MRDEIEIQDCMKENLNNFFFGKLLSIAPEKISSRMFFASENLNNFFLKITFNSSRKMFSPNVFRIRNFII